MHNFQTYLLAVNLILSGFETKLIEDQSYWHTLGRNDIDEALKHTINTNRAKNVILFIGDGLGLSTITASRIYHKTERGYLSFERFPNIAVLKTYSANKIVPDSCSTATAMFCGVKANQKTSGVDATVAENDCPASLNANAQLDSIVAWAQRAGMKTGFVTTTRVTHATPSALYAHTPNRNWECEAKIPVNASSCKDIARQLIEDLPGRNINVIMGGGKQCLQSHSIGNANDPIDTWACYSKDKRDLIKSWIEDKQTRNVTHKYVSTNKELSQLTLDEDYVLGVFANGHLRMNFQLEKDDAMPSLQNMTSAAIKLLKNKAKNAGFLLMVEGGLIDFAHHRGHARQALDETVAFSNAIREAMQLTTDQASETLIIVTSDHSHPLVIAGYADRSTPITGVAQPSKHDKLPYTTLLYGVGGISNYNYSVIDEKVVRANPLDFNTSDFYYSQQAGIVTDEVVHDGTDVVVYAQGPMAHLFHSVHEQTYVAHVIGFAAKIGPYADERTSSSVRLIPQYVGILLLLAISIN